MKVEKNRKLFFVLAGLVSSGANAYDHNDTEVAALAERIVSLDISINIRTWFSHARTGQVEVNPYWPRGSALSAACFFVEKGIFDIDTFFSFFESTAISDPIGIDDFRLWISELPKVLLYMETQSDLQSLWDEYNRIVEKRMPKWICVIDEANKTAQRFYNDNAPEMSFSPNLFSAYSTDFVRTGNKIITIAAEPDIESMLHETLHTIVAAYRDRILTYSEKHGLIGFADRDKMMELGYMEDDSASSITHVIEECFVRAISVVLAGKNDERLCVHAEFGCDGVPFIASHFKKLYPTVNDFGAFVDTVFSDMINDLLKKRVLAVIPKNSVGRYDLLPVFMDSKLFADIVNYLATPYIGKIDYVAAPEAIGWVLGSAMARALNVGFVPIRKIGNLPYPKDLLTSQDYVDYSNKAKALEIKKDYVKPGDRILIVDEWVETGVSLHCCKNLLEKLGCTIVGLATIGIDYQEGTKAWIDMGFIRYIGRDI